jgi:hypothetical protein
MSGLTIGATYYISVSGVAGTAAAKSIRITTNADGSTGALFTQLITGTSITYSFVATATTHYLALIVTGGAENQTFSVSQASVKQITAITGMPSTYTRNNGGVFPPRFDYDPVTLAPKGILIEEQRVNLVTYSEEFDNAAWAKSNSTITANSTAAPDGTATADTLVENTATSTHFTNRIISASASTAYTQSIFVKAAERTRGLLQIFGNSGGSTVNFDLTAGTAVASGAYGGWASASATITNFGNGWYRITNTATTNVGLTAINWGVYLADASGSGSYTGNGTSGFFIWGAQLEAGAFATSYIPTVASTVTRAGDNCAIVAPMFAPWYNQSEGTLVFEGSSAAPATLAQTLNALTASDGTNNNIHRIGRFSNFWFGETRDGNVAQTNPSAGTYTQNTTAKVAYAYKTNDFAISANGAAAVTDTSGTVPTVLDRLNIGAPTLQLNGHIRSVQYYPVRLADFQLQAITA